MTFPHAFCTESHLDGDGHIHHKEDRAEVLGGHCCPRPQAGKRQHLDSGRSVSQPGPLAGPQEALEAGDRPPGSKALRRGVGSSTLPTQTRSLQLGLGRCLLSVRSQGP